MESILWPPELLQQARSYGKQQGRKRSGEELGRQNDASSSRDPELDGHAYDLSAEVHRSQLMHERRSPIGGGGGGFSVPAGISLQRADFPEVDGGGDQQGDVAEVHVGVPTFGADDQQGDLPAGTHGTGDAAVTGRVFTGFKGRGRGYRAPGLGRGRHQQFSPGTFLDVDGGAMIILKMGG